MRPVTLATRDWYRAFSNQAYGQAANSCSARAAASSLEPSFCGEARQWAREPGVAASEAYQVPEPWAPELAVGEGVGG